MSADISAARGVSAAETTAALWATDGLDLSTDESYAVGSGVAQPPVTAVRPCPPRRRESLSTSGRGRCAPGTTAPGGCVAPARPFDAFWSLASVLGLLLVFKGTLDIIGAVMTRDVNSTWWLGLVVGILELVLGFWASQQLFPARGALLLLWVGFFALFRGI